MQDLNKVIILGRFTHDPEIRHKAGASTLALFTLACNWATKDKDGVDFIGCSAWGRTAEVVEEYCERGKQVIVEGKLTSYKKEENGKMRYGMQVTANYIRLLGSSKQAEEEEREREFDDNGDLDDTPF